MTAAVGTAAAYDRCEVITREQAANFYYGIRLLARERRRAMCAVYAFARRIDDIGDGSLPRERKRAMLDRAAAQLALLEASGRAPEGLEEDAVLVALADAHVRFRLPAGALGELIDGVWMDVEEVEYDRFEELEPYCRRVAGAIGRVCLAIFAPRDPDALASERERAEALADDLGVALQLTNIVRDVREDAENGRVYLPAEDLRRFGLLDDARANGGGGGGDEEDIPRAAQLRARLDDAGASEALIALVRFEAERAERWFERGRALVPLLDRRSAACVAAMAGIYHRLLERIEAEPQRVLRERVSLPSGEKAWVAVRSMVAGSRA